MSKQDLNPTPFRVPASRPRPIHGRTHPFAALQQSTLCSAPHDPRCLRHHLAARSNMMWPETCTSTAPHFPASTLPGACRAMQGTDLCLRNPDVVGHESSAQQTWIDEKTPRAQNVAPKMLLMSNQRSQTLTPSTDLCLRNPYVASPRSPGASWPQCAPRDLNVRKHLYSPGCCRA